MILRAVSESSRLVCAVADIKMTTATCHCPICPRCMVWLVAVVVTSWCCNGHEKNDVYIIDTDGDQKFESLYHNDMID
jgi:hypothetical protein